MIIFTQKLRLCSLLGDRFNLSVQDFCAILAKRKVVLFICLAVTVMITMDTSRPQVTLDLWMKAVVWPASVAAFLTLYVVGLAIFGVIQIKIIDVVFPIQLVSVLSFIPAGAVGEYLSWYLTNKVFEVDVMARVIFFLPCLLVLETVFYRFVLPTMLPMAELACAEKIATATIAQPALATPATAATEDGKAPEVRYLLIGNHRVPVSRIRHIEAREHHVRVTMDSTILTRRARLGDIVAQTLPEDGFQPHRSWWVSRNEALEIEREGNRHSLKLHDDTRIPVARTRLSEVQNWVAEHSDKSADLHCAQSDKRLKVPGTSKAPANHIRPANRHSV
ncbi:hypothetical protein P775_19340 [Puniceibacterium antarcticum]|uniref:HTH LytTR-type domain-containing protein n=1 Tax=Puniceibacterium antarcticum TaxID=1206336 RepID=A0A2G8RCA2_9RHOB|nr:LytTR family DNA-binding domain-containing protein [Puniceibacterium antarcticum]PIL18728.1 hypothetical protein P775_19340 [Puniceibacterium antarcticum]